MGRATHPDRTADARMGSCKGKGPKANAPDQGGTMAERVTPFHSGLRLTPSELRVVLGLLSRRIALRPRARLAARRRGGGGRGRAEVAMQVMVAETDRL